MEEVRIKGLETALENLSKKLNKPQETVTISLEKYDEFLFYKKKYENMISMKRDIERLINQPSFDSKDCFHRQIYKIYETLMI